MARRSPAILVSAAVVFLVSMACREQPHPAEPPGGAAEPADPGAAPLTGSSSGLGLSSSSGSSGTTAKSDPLRDPRERRLREVRQLTHGLAVASPRFSPDGTAIWFLAKEGTRVTVRRLPAVGGAMTTLPSPAGTPWELVEGVGGPCVVSAAGPCGGEPWPEPEGLLACKGLSLTPAAAGITCFDAPAPSVGTVNGLRACPERDVGDAGSLMALALSAGETPLLLGPAGGRAFAPVFSPGGQRLIFVSQAEGAMHLWLTRTDPGGVAALPVGPEARRVLDPTFAPSGEAVLFASTLDDAAGQELDLELLTLATGALERVTFASGGDRFAAFSADGRRLAWVSERNADPGQQDLFVAQWEWEPAKR